MAIIKTRKGEEILVDDDKLDYLSQFTWHVNRGYAETGIHDPIAKRTYRYAMHRMLTDCPKGMCVDHINANKLDNRMENLDIVTRAENNRRAHAMGLHSLDRNVRNQTGKTITVEEKYRIMKERSRLFKRESLS